MKIGSSRPSPLRSRRTTTGVFPGSSTRTAINSISTIPEPYREGGLIADDECGSKRRSGPAEVVAQGGADHGRPEVVGQLGELLQHVHRLLARRRPALLQERADELFEQAGLALGRHLVHPQVAGLDAVPVEAG